MSDPEVSLVVPVYNEAECLGPLASEIHVALSTIDERYELIFVDDGSTDRSPHVLQELAQADPKVKVLRLARNCGKSAALDAGFRRAYGSIIVMLDADLQNDPADIPLLLRELRSCDAVAGVRARRQDAWLRRVSSRIANTIRRHLTRDPTRDSGCGIQAFRSEVLAEIPMFGGMHRFLPTLARMAGARVREIAVNHRPRRFGQAKYGVRNRALRALRDLFAVRWMQRRAIDRTLAEDATPEVPDSTEGA